MKCQGVAINWDSLNMKIVLENVDLIVPPIRVG